MPKIIFSNASTLNVHKNDAAHNNLHKRNQLLQKSQFQHRFGHQRFFLFVCVGCGERKDEHCTYYLCNILALIRFDNVTHYICPNILSIAESFSSGETIPLYRRLWEKKKEIIIQVITNSRIVFATFRFPFEYTCNTLALPMPLEYYVVFMTGYLWLNYGILFR